MNSAFRRGIELLSTPESGAAESQGKTVESPGSSASGHMESMGVVPKNVAHLAPVIDKLLRKVIIMITI